MTDALAAPLEVTRRTEESRDGLGLLRGFLICGLVLTAGTGVGGAHAFVRGALPLLAGLALGVALLDAKRSTLSPRWAMHLLVTWLVTFSPVMWGNREVLRTTAVAAGLAVAWRAAGRARAFVLLLPLVVLLTTLAAPSSYWLRLASSELLYGLGGAWPRGGADVARDFALFFAGCWTAGSAQFRTLAGWRGAAHPFRALGRMPLTALTVQYAWGAPPWADVLLAAQLAFAVVWLRRHERGPCEQIVHGAGVASRSARAWVRAQAHAAMGTTVDPFNHS